MSKNEKTVPPILLAPDVKRTIDCLKNSLLHAMSLGNHELYHSNIWAWLINRYAGFAAVFFPELEGKAAVAKREEKNRDITIRPFVGSTDLFVIENKFKALPTVEQLKSYTDVCGKNERICRGIVIGIADPEWTESSIVGSNKGQWSFVPFSKIIEEIASRIDIFADDRDKILLSRYCETTETSLSLLSQLVKHYHGKLPDPGQNWEELRSVRLRDVFFKISAQQFKNWLAKEKDYLQLKNEFSNQGLKLSLSNGFSNGSWIVNAEIRNRRILSPTMKPADHPWFGLQLQGRQFRRCATGFKLSPDEELGYQLIFEKFCALDWFETTMKSGWRAGALTVTQRENKKMYGTFSPDFVHQYIDLKDYSWLSLKEGLLQHLRVALRLKNPF